MFLNKSKKHRQINENIKSFEKDVRIYKLIIEEDETKLQKLKVEFECFMEIFNEEDDEHGFKKDRLERKIENVERDIQSYKEKTKVANRCIEKLKERKSDG